MGAALAMPLVAWLIGQCGWRLTFMILGGLGLAWALFWYQWFRDEPADAPGVSDAERDLILSQRQSSGSDAGEVPPLTAGVLFGSRNMWLAMGQYICSNFTFFFAISWSFPYLKRTFELTDLQAGMYSAIPLLCGAAGNWVAGALVDRVYRMGRWRLSTERKNIHRKKRSAF